MSNDALKLLTMAVDRLKDYEETSFYDNAIAALTAQQTQEPVGYMVVQKKEWVGLTKEEIKEISFANRPYVVDMVVALEAKLKEKNT